MVENAILHVVPVDLECLVAAIPAVVQTVEKSAMAPVIFHACRLKFEMGVVVVAVRRKDEEPDCRRRHLRQRRAAKGIAGHCH